MWIAGKLNMKIAFYATMRPDFSNASVRAMNIAKHGMNDFRMIMGSSDKLLEPAGTILFHEEFIKNLFKWFEKDLCDTRVVITHHAPVVNPNTQYGDSNLMPAFNSLDMKKVIRKYKPRLWVYGHTHECDKQMAGKTQVISNQLGYPNRYGGFECRGFDEAGVVVEI